jgi:hypothetical protein
MNPNLLMFPFICTYVCCDWKNVVDKYMNGRLGAFMFYLIIAIHALKHLCTCIGGGVCLFMSLL